MVSTAYTYLLRHIPTNTFYYGVEWKRGCDPKNFWKTYFTSSKKIVPLLRTLFGDDSFEFEIRKIFSDKKKAVEWESKVLQRMRVIERPDVWLNRTNNRAILNEVAPNKGKKLPWVSEFNKRPETIEKRRQDKLGKKRPPFSDEWKINIGNAARGRRYKRGPLSEDHKRKISIAVAAKKRMVIS